MLVLSGMYYISIIGTLAYNILFTCLKYQVEHNILAIASKSFTVKLYSGIDISISESLVEKPFFNEPYIYSESAICDFWLYFIFF